MSDKLMQYPMLCQNTWTAFDTSFIATSKEEAERLYNEKYKGHTIVLEVYDPIPIDKEKKALNDAIGDWLDQNGID